MWRLDTLGTSERNLVSPVCVVYRGFCELQLDNRSLSKESSVLLRWIFPGSQNSVCFFFVLVWFFVNTVRKYQGWDEFIRLFGYFTMANSGEQAVNRKNPSGKSTIRWASSLRGKETKQCTLKTTSIPLGGWWKPRDCLQTAGRFYFCYSFGTRQLILIHIAEDNTIIFLFARPMR